MIPKKDSEHTSRIFGKIRSRQLIGVSLTVWALVIIAVLSRRPDLFGYIEKGRASVLQLMVIVVFVCFSAWNWRCPSCKKYLGSGFMKKACRKCGAILIR